MKTIREWLSELPKEISESAIRQYESNYFHELDKEYGSFIDKRKEESLKDALCSSFVWTKSDEGFKFWNKVWEEN